MIKIPLLCRDVKARVPSPVSYRSLAVISESPLYNPLSQLPTEPSTLYFHCTISSTYSHSLAPPSCVCYVAPLASPVPSCPLSSLIFTVVTSLSLFFSPFPLLSRHIPFLSLLLSCGSCFALYHSCLHPALILHPVTSLPALSTPFYSHDHSLLQMPCSFLPLFSTIIPLSILP